MGQRVFRPAVWARCLTQLARAFVSREVRDRLAKNYLLQRIGVWQGRKQMGPAHVSALRAQLESQHAGSYLADFGMHLAIKPVVKTCQFALLPALWSVGVVGDGVLAVGFLMAGSVARTVYTLLRVVQELAAGRRAPWVALGVGAVPTFGNLAFPIEILYSGTRAEGRIARFLLRDLFCRLGQWVPIWGGPDTLTEHVFHAIPAGVFRRFGAEAAGVEPNRTQADQGLLKEQADQNVDVREGAEVLREGDDVLERVEGEAA